MDEVAERPPVIVTPSELVVKELSFVTFPFPLPEI